jgi:hypothetical protein
MYSVVEYNNYRKEQTFEIKIITDNLDYAKKYAFNRAKTFLNTENETMDECDKITNKITTNISEKYLYPNNDIIIEYSVITVRECDDDDNDDDNNDDDNNDNDDDDNDDDDNNDNDDDDNNDNNDDNTIKYKIISSYSTIFSVIKLTSHIEIENLENIDETLICNNLDWDE